MPRDWGDYMLKRLDEDELVAKSESDRVRAALRSQRDKLTGKTKRLFDVYLDGDIERDEYLERRAELMSKKKSLESKLEDLARDSGLWIEPMRKWVMTAVSLCEIGFNTPHSEIADACRKIDGLNLFMKDKNVVAFGDGNIKSPLKNPWQALRAANQKPRAGRGANDENYSMVAIYTMARTHFSTK